MPPITDHRSPITDHRSPITDYRSPITDHRSPITDYRSPITDYRLPITDYRLPITDYSITLVTFPPCKINIGLQVISRREDGFHDIATVFYPVPLTDVLEVISSPGLDFRATGIPVPGGEDENLCIKAYRLLKNDFPGLPPVSIHLHKAIPVGAGLGGGSSDAAGMLKLLNEKYRLGITPKELTAYASRLGSDCAFFLQNKPCYATGRGDELYPFVREGLDGYRFLLVCPGIHINTGWAYSKIIPKTPSRSLLDLVREPVDTWRGKIVNDFEQPVFQAHPSLAGIKDTLYRHGALYAAMSGSGSAMFGIFRRGDQRIADASFGDARVFSFG